MVSAVWQGRQVTVTPAPGMQQGERMQVTLPELDAEGQRIEWQVEREHDQAIEESRREAEARRQEHEEEASQRARRVYEQRCRDGLEEDKDELWEMFPPFMGGAEGRRWLSDDVMREMQEYEDDMFSEGGESESESE